MIKLLITIKRLTSDDIKPLSAAFISEGFNKTEMLFQQYYQEQLNGKRSVFIAMNKRNHYLGYLTIIWKSAYKNFSDQQIPEISDLNVIPSQQKQGIGTELLNFAENNVANKHKYIGLAVGLHKDYGPAQSLYVKRGYVPNKEGITYNLKKVTPGKPYCIDDDCLLWMTKHLLRNDNKK